jgi:uncharacterized protein
VVAARPVDAVRDCVAFERGPVVYCLEHSAAADDIAVRPAPAVERPLDDWLPGATGLEIDGRTFAPAAEEASWPYHDLSSLPDRSLHKNERWLLVPYFAWGNRGAGPMRVWLPIRHGVAGDGGHGDDDE